MKRALIGLLAAGMLAVGMVGGVSAGHSPAHCPPGQEKAGKCVVPPPPPPPDCGIDCPWGT